ncbi:hypothetical protein K7432_008011 [Basidiobolus ranarum]|uniref:AN1-type domain-containing protein n=1 Tax=Basidiobolus ranarum TaxID=34480 RepID=A0ABR2VZB0_9FUNG
MLFNMVHFFKSLYSLLTVNSSQDHWRPEQHQCPYEQEVSDVRVPVCPLCEKPVPVNKGENPNRRIDEHIRKGCKDPGTTTDSSPAYRNVCSYSTCKTKVLVSAKCPACHKQYCLKHRFEVDHDCPKDAKPGGSSKPSRTPKLSMFNGTKPPPSNAHKEKSGKSKSKHCLIS